MEWINLVQDGLRKEAPYVKSLDVRFLDLKEALILIMLKASYMLLVCVFMGLWVSHNSK